MMLDKIYTFDFDGGEFTEIHDGPPMFHFYVDAIGQRFAAVIQDSIIVNVWAVETGNNQLILTEHIGTKAVRVAREYDDIWTATQLDETLLPLEVYDLLWIVDDARARLAELN